MRDALDRYAGELRAMNRRVNLVSREDQNAIESRHIPHCLALALRRFPPRAIVCDWGTGGG
ncbi:MAG: RsmG family class I SAM-dependent methyltransferase, partial [Bacteroidota bacterium]